MALEKQSKKLITEECYFPRSEYYTRYQGTTAFKMDNPDYYGSYHRSERTRFFKIAGGRRQVEFASPMIEKPAGNYTSLYAHTGGIASPFSQEYYSDGIAMDRRAPIAQNNVHDALLLYKRKMANVIVDSFEAESDNNQCVKEGHRKIVFVENDYPCVMINFPAVNPLQTETGKKWAKNPKPLQKLLIASFIAYLNMEAEKAHIPIEMVLRASFGHNLPSICETNNTFRINVGVIPKEYAQLIGKTLAKVNEEIARIEEEGSVPAKFNVEFYKKLREYNAEKLKVAIDKHARYKQLRNSRDYQKAANSEEAFTRLYNSYCRLNKENKKELSRSTFVPVKLDGKTVWEVLSQKGSSRGDTLLRQCFFKNKTVDWFADKVMEGLDNKVDSPIEYALDELLKLAIYDNTVTMNYSKIDRDLRKKKRGFATSSFKEIYKEDKEFLQIITMLFAAFGAKKADESIYAGLEYAGYEFFSHMRGSQVVTENCDYGSDSEFSDDFKTQEMISTKQSNRKILRIHNQHISHAKLRVCSGMKAIMVAQYGALFHIKNQGEKFYSKDVEQMYYEVENGLKALKYPGITERGKLIDRACILQYDLNHCNASNAGNNESLYKKLIAHKPKVVILDYTSSTYTEVDRALKQCFAHDYVDVVIMVQSGLKNEQGGQDFNPYGEVRVLTRNRKTNNAIIQQMKQGLSEDDQLFQEVHELVRACKRAGFAMSFYGHRKTERVRFQSIPEYTGPKRTM